MSDPSRTTPLAGKLLRELDAADPETFRRLAEGVRFREGCRLDVQHGGSVVLRRTDAV